MNYYNEFDPKAAAWIQQLIDDKQIPYGYVDSRSILEVQPSDLSGFVQCHFFAGIGGWSLALRLADWPEDRPVWTASLPCQPFSTAGKQLGTSDERHLSPTFLELVRQCDPPVIIGEQVASKLARTDWLPGIRLELEALGYSFGAADLCAPCAGEIGEGRIVRGDQESWERVIIGAPHIRQRLYWVADRGVDYTCGGGFVGRAPRSEQAFEGRPSDSQPIEFRELQAGPEGPSRDGEFRGPACTTDRMADSPISDQRGHSGGSCNQAAEMQGETRSHHGAELGGSGSSDGLGDPLGSGPQARVNESCANESGPERASQSSVSDRMADAQSGGQRINGSASRSSGYTDECGQGHQWKRVSFAMDCIGYDEETGECGDECSICGLTYADDCQCPGPTQDGYEYEERDGVLYAHWVGDTRSEGPQGHAGDESDGSEPGRQHQEPDGSTGSAGWTHELLPCRDGKTRRTQRGIFPLSYGIPRGVVPSGDPNDPSYANATAEARAARLKGYGNAIVPPLAALFIRSFTESQA